MMQKPKVLVIAVVVIAHTLTMTRYANAADNTWGVWTDKEQSYVYAFLENSEFEFWGQKSTWRADIQRYTYTKGKTDGVWQYEEGICWIGDKKPQYGNLMIYVESLQCCMMVQFLGNKLVLSEIWNKGKDELGLCTNRVLTKASAIPND